MSRILERTLPCLLTEPEVRHRVKLYSSKQREIRDLEYQEAKFKHDMKLKRVPLEQDLAVLQSEIADETEQRMVKCEWVGDIEKQTMELVRQDTGETVEKRRMTVEESDKFGQTDLLDPVPAGPGPLEPIDDHGNLESEDEPALASAEAQEHEAEGDA